MAAVECWEGILDTTEKGSADDENDCTESVMMDARENAPVMREKLRDQTEIGWRVPCIKTTFLYFSKFSLL